MGRRPIRKVARTGAERTRPDRREHAATKPPPTTGADDAANTMDVLRKELAQAKTRMHGLEAEVAALKAELADSVGGRFAPRQRSAAKPKTGRPPLPPDEERDRIIKGL